MENGDDWLAMDKLYHVLFGFSIAIFTSLVAGRTRYPFIRRRSIWVGSLVSLAAGAAKEVADELGFFKSAGASSKDAVADALGTLIAAFVLLLAKPYSFAVRPDPLIRDKELGMV
nr:60S ribosomal protein L7-1 [Ipomoea batatas]